MENLFIGLMSGTSLDGIDAVIARFDDGADLIATTEHEIPTQLRNRLRALIDSPDSVALDELGALHRELAASYTDAVTQLLNHASLDAGQISAIGCHGQTIRHLPDGVTGFSLQIGDGAALAASTGIAVVNDFRSADIALGGQGAPLVPAFHREAFGDPQRDRVIVNIGGIANITMLKTDRSVNGWDTGPGNTLLDTWCEKHLGKPFDRDGAWAAAGDVSIGLLETLLTDTYFSSPPPKSTGREYFNLTWLQRYLDAAGDALTPVDVQATLTELTAASIAAAILESESDRPDVFLCGGGAANTLLSEKIAGHLPDMSVATTAALGIAPDWVEAAAFAWLARARLQAEPGNIPQVTGASRPAVLGALHQP